MKQTYHCEGKQYHSCMYGLGQCQACWLYQQGEGIDANYPVPANITEVSIHPTHVAVCILTNVPGSDHDWHGDGWDVYHYGY